MMSELALLRQQVQHLVQRQTVLETENQALHSQLVQQSPPRASSSSRASTAMSVLAATTVSITKAAAAPADSKFEHVKGDWWQLPLSDAVSQVEHV
jgi:DNA recombination-dependent growth factor C